MKNVFVLLTVFFLPFLIHAQDDSYAIDAPKQEFRGVWVATVLNIDFPKKATPNGVAHSEQWKKLLDKYKKMGMNAVVVQVRPAGDALYPTDLAPWSAYLTGKQGRAPLRDYDPLKGMVAEAHNRGMEFHAWFNPYRLSMNLDTAALASNHVFYQHPEWVIQYGTKYYLDPGIPEVQDYLIDVVGEVVEKYDIDAVHFDDYFYPYQIKDQIFPDTATFRQFGGDFGSIADWRRNNVDFFIDSLSLRIKQIDPYVKFGISPFGVWRNKANDPLGSNTRAGLTSYDNLYADVVKWLKNDWIDYVAPQLYWHIGFPAADYEELLGWWRRNSYGKHLYIGHAVYKINDDKYEEWNNPNEMLRQIQRVRSDRFATQGSIFFSSRQLLKNPLGFTDSLRNRYYAPPALLPPMTLLNDSIPVTPILKKMRPKNGNVKLRWKLPRSAKGSPPAYYVIYRFTNDDDGDLDDSKNIVGITPIGQDVRCFIDGKTKSGKVYNYQITAVSRTHVESEPSNRRMIHKIGNSLKNVKRLPEEFVVENKKRVEEEKEQKKKNSFFYD
ncbi:MAG: glycoside hydrolase family 10 protein [Saprospiraceae bacterium]